jgi:phosphatidylglycerol lysyltransferase
MNAKSKVRFRFSNIFGPRFVAALVLIHGISIVVLSLLEQIVLRHHLKPHDTSLFINLGIGLTLIYLSSLLGRRKRSALIATAVVYAFYLGSNIEGLIDAIQAKHHIGLFLLIRSIILPIAVLLVLLINRRKYVVRSDSQGFQSAIVTSFIILAVTFVYGTLGFYVLGKSGFHQQLSVPAAMHYSVDQFNLTTNKPIHAYNHKATLFTDSLSFVSAFAFLYVLISFAQPLRARFGDQKAAREKFLQLLRQQHDSVSEDFFKLWPHDKQYFFDSSETSGLAFHVYRGSALVLAGPAGKEARFRQLLSEFQYVCSGNDWRPSIIHADDSLSDTYEDLGYTMQKIGEEAIVDLHKFTSETIKDKYFRNISSRFKKQEYSFEILSPPHHPAVVSRVHEVSDQWLSRGNHAERGFAMGYYTDEYINMCDLAVARDAAGTIQGFLNLIPADFDSEEATYDLLRASKKATSNINDYLLMGLCQSLLEAGYKRLNLGLCPLVGMEAAENKGLIGNFLGFTYANVDRFYSFSGLFRFKDKYQPEWKARYVVYKGGIRGFSKTMNALMRVMSTSAKARTHLPRS